MATQRQIESARINGVLSRGPKTPEGKSRSARNALKHGLTSRTIPLDPQSAAELEQMVAEYTADIHPSTPQEALLARRLGVATFWIRRAWAAETEVWTRALAKYESFPAQDRLALAAVAISNQLTQIMRHESHFDRQFHVALTRLMVLRKNRADREKLILQNEPDRDLPTQSFVLQNEPDSHLSQTNPATPSQVDTRETPEPVLQPTTYDLLPHELRPTNHDSRSALHTCAPRSHPPRPILLIPLPPSVVPCLPGHLL